MVHYLGKSTTTQVLPDPFLIIFLDGTLLQIRTQIFSGQILYRNFFLGMRLCWAAMHDKTVTLGCIQGRNSILL